MTMVTTFYLGPTRLSTAMALAILVVVAAANGTPRAIAVELGDTPECAPRDLGLLMSKEAHRDAEDISGNTLSYAFLTMVKAGAACAAGHVDEALEIYDRVAIVLDRAVRK
jgi:hypothetical protein